jgi:hypothetical protein
MRTFTPPYDPCLFPTAKVSDGTKNQQGIYRGQPTVPTGPRYGNDAYGGGSAISGYDFNHAMTGSWGIPTSQPQYNGDYSMVSKIHPMLRTIIHLFYHSIKPSIPHGNPEQGETNYAGYHFGTYQVPGPTMNFSPYPPEANINQAARRLDSVVRCIRLLRSD